MFMSTLGYRSDKFIECAMKATIAADERGKHNHSYHMLKPMDEEFMEQHILTFQPGISHYRREHAPHCLYVDSSLTIHDMYESYIKACQKKGESLKVSVPILES